MMRHQVNEESRRSTLKKTQPKDAGFMNTFDAVTSLLLQSDLKKILSLDNFRMLPPECRKRLLNLLPNIYASAFDRHEAATFALLNNEYFTHACLDFKERFLSSQLDRKCRVRSARLKYCESFEPWKARHLAILRSQTSSLEHMRNGSACSDEDDGDDSGSMCSSAAALMVNQRQLSSQLPAMLTQAQSSHEQHRTRPSSIVVRDSCAGCDGRHGSAARSLDMRTDRSEGQAKLPKICINLVSKQLKLILPSSSKASLDLGLDSHNEVSLRNEFIPRCSTTSQHQQTVARKRMQVNVPAGEGPPQEKRTMGNDCAAFSQRSEFCSQRGVQSPCGADRLTRTVHRAADLSNSVGRSTSTNNNWRCDHLRTRLTTDCCSSPWLSKSPAFVRTSLPSRPIGTPGSRMPRLRLPVNAVGQSRFAAPSRDHLMTERLSTIPSVSVRVRSGAPLHFGPPPAQLHSFCRQASIRQKQAEGGAIPLIELD